MERKKPIGLTSGRLFCFFTAVIFAVFYADYFLRELWFDEVITLQFALLPSIADIYRTYTIPNNQIVHTCFIHLMLALDIPAGFMRLFPLFCGGIMLFLLWKNFARKMGRMQMLTALTALLISPPFLLYSTALRGYMLAAMLTVMALCAGKSYALSGKKTALAAWGVFAALSTGVMPSALAGIAAAGLYITPYCGKKYWKSRRVYLLAATALAGPVLFYAPIHKDLLKAFELKEGWHNGWYALGALFLAVIVTFAVPLTAALFCHRPKMRHLPRTLIWLLPLGGLLLPVYPFPRVWWILFPVLALCCAGYLRKMPVKYLRILPASALLWGGLTCTLPVRKTLSPAVSSGGQDDFYAPRFAGREFTPSDTAAWMIRNGGMLPAFVSFEADPFALNYALAMKRPGINGAGQLPPVWPDVPLGTVPLLPDNTLCILAKEEDPSGYETRFNGLLQLFYGNGLHRIYLYRVK